LICKAVYITKTLDTPRLKVIGGRYGGQLSPEEFVK
jgi:hypothetical protein